MPRALVPKCFCESTISEVPPTGSITGDQWSALTSCGHIFHTLCIMKWHGTNTNYKCPNGCSYKDTTWRPSVGSRKKKFPYLRLWVENPDELNSDFDMTQIVNDNQAEINLAEEEEEEEGEDDEDVFEDELFSVIIPGEDELTRTRREKAILMAEVRELRGYRTQITQIRHHADRLVDLVQDLERANEQFEHSVAERDEEIEELREEIRGYEEEIDAYEQETRPLKAAKRELKNQLEVLKLKSHETEHRLQVKLNQAEAKLRLEGNNGAKEIASLKTQLEEKEDQILKLRVIGDRAEIEANKLVKEIQQETEKIQTEARQEAAHAVNKELSAKTELKNCKSKLEKLESANSSFRDQVSKLKRKLEAAKKRKGIANLDEDSEEDETQDDIELKSPRAKRSRTNKSTEPNLPFSLRSTNLFGPNNSRLQLPLNSPPLLAAVQPGPSQLKPIDNRAMIVLEDSSDSDGTVLPAIDRFSENRLTNPPVPMPSLAGHGPGPAHKPSQASASKLTSLKTDKYLPDLSRTVHELGPKRKPKLGR